MELSEAEAALFPDAATPATPPKASKMAIQYEVDPAAPVKVAASKARTGETYIVEGRRAKFLCLTEFAGDTFASFKPEDGGKPMLLDPATAVECIPPPPPPKPVAPPPAPVAQVVPPDAPPSDPAAAAAAEKPKRGRKPKSETPAQPTESEPEADFFKRLASALRAAADELDAA